MGSPWGRRVHAGSRGFTRAHLDVVARTFGFAWVHSGVPTSRRVHSGSRAFTLAHLGAQFEFAWVHSDASIGGRVHSC